MDSNSRRTLLRSGLATAALTSVAMLSRTERVAASTFDPWIDVRTFGAVGDGVVNDTSAIQSALNSIPPSGGTVYFPAGTFRVTAPLTVSNRHVGVLGAGRGVTTIRREGGGGGFDFSFSQYNQRLTFEGLSLLTATQAGGIAIRAAWPTPPTSGDSTQEPHFADFHIGPADQYVAYWSKGLEIINGRGTKISKFYIQGRTNTVSMSHGIHLRGSSVIVFVDAGSIYSVNEGIVAEDTSEGLYFSNLEVVFANNGFRLQTNGTPGSAITNCHVNSLQTGIYLLGHNDMAVIGNLLYRTADTNWVGIYVVGSPFCQIIGNNLTVTTSGAHRNGIILDASPNCTIGGNVIRDVDTGVWLAGGSTSQCVVTGNRIVNPGFTGVLDWGIGNLIANNL